MLRAPAESATLWLVLGKKSMTRPAERMTQQGDNLPDDIDVLRALILAERAARAADAVERNAIAAERDQLAGGVANMPIPFDPVNGPKFPQGQ